MRIRLALAAAFSLVQAAPAFAERDPYSGAPLRPDSNREIPSPITDRFYVRGTYFSASTNTNLRVDVQNHPPGIYGTPVNGERDLGLPDRINQGRVEVMFRIRERNRLRIDFLDADRSGSQTLGEPVTFGDVIFPAGQVASSVVNFRMLGLTYTYSFYRSERLEIGTGLGVYLLEAEAIEDVTALHQRQEVSGAGAFPTIPLDVTWRISSRFALTARGQYLRATWNDSSGSIGDYHADVQYRWTRAFAVGVGYSYISTKLDLATGSYPGEFDLTLKGPEAFFRVSF